MKRAWLLGGLLGLLSSCASERGPMFATSARFPEAPRRPPSFAPEAPVERAAVTSLGKVDEGTLRVSVPLDSDTARDVVGRFFSAVLAESTESLSTLFANQAWTVSESGRQPALSAWRTRFAQLDYASLNGQIVAAPSTLRTYTFATAGRAKNDGVPAPSSVSEVVVVARPLVAWTGKARLFGERLAFRLRPMRDAPGYEIAEIVEEFRLP